MNAPNISAGTIATVMKEVRQTGFPVVLVFAIGLGGHHWATRWFEEIVVPESKAKVAMVESVSATNKEVVPMLRDIAITLKQLREERVAVH